MSSYEFTTIRDGRRMTVVVESTTPERAERTLQRTMGASAVRLIGVSGADTASE